MMLNATVTVFNECTFSSGRFDEQPRILSQPLRFFCHPRIEALDRGHEFCETERLRLLDDKVALIVDVRKAHTEQLVVNHSIRQHLGHRLLRNPERSIVWLAIEANVENKF